MTQQSNNKTENTKSEKSTYRKRGSLVKTGTMNSEYHIIIDSIIANMKPDEEITNGEIVDKINSALGINLRDKAKYGKGFIPTDIPLMYLKDNKANMDSLGIQYEKKGQTIVYFKEE